MSWLEKTPPPSGNAAAWGEALKRYLDKVKTAVLNGIRFDMVNPTTVSHGGLAWNIEEDTLNLGHANGVKQSLGMEDYFPPCFNDTGSTIPNGTVLGFAGVTNGYLLVSPYIADSSANPLYFVGVATEEIADQSTGKVTRFGYINDIDTSSFAAGQILYASPTTSGALTATRPTAPNAVVVVAAAIKSDSTDGRILVRPTVPIGLDYGSFSDTTIQTLSAANTPTAILHNTTDIANGVSVENDGSSNPTQLTVSQAGLYKVTVSNQYSSSNASAQDIQTWLRQNGTDIPNSNSYLTLSANGQTAIFSTAYVVSMEAGDYLQVMWASNSTDVSINNIAATAYSPAAPSCITSIAQIQL